MSGHRIFLASMATIYPLYVAKAERKGRLQADVDKILCWLTGHDLAGLQAAIMAGQDMQTFFALAPKLNLARLEVTGVVCGVRIEALDDPLMREIRILDKLVDELAKGRPMQRILRA